MEHTVSLNKWGNTAVELWHPPPIQNHVYLFLLFFSVQVVSFFLHTLSRRDPFCLIVLKAANSFFKEWPWIQLKYLGSVYFPSSYNSSRFFHFMHRWAELSILLLLKRSKCHNSPTIVFPVAPHPCSKLWLDSCLGSFWKYCCCLVWVF